MAEEVIQLDINEINPNPLQPRGAITPESLVDLVDSIKEHGVLEPLVVAKTPAGYQIIAGERRWRASKLAGLTHVPCIVRETTPKGMLEMALVENVQRVDLNPIDRAKGFERLMNEFGMTTSEVAIKIGKSVSYVSNTIRLLALPDALKDGLLSGLITEGHARALAGIEDQELMIEAYKIILRESASVRRAEELARRMKHKAGQKPKPQARESQMRIISEEIDRMQEEMLQALKKLEKDGDENSSQVKLSRSRRETRVSFILKGSPEETEERLQKIYKALVS
jgi:ParB family chromosome partitioning protein